MTSKSPNFGDSQKWHGLSAPTRRPLGLTNKWVQQLLLAQRRRQTLPRSRLQAGWVRGTLTIKRLTNQALDPFAKIPEIKYCTVHVSLGGVPHQQASYGGGQLLAALNARN